MATCDWSLGNGQILTFHVYPIQQTTNWSDRSGLYIFTSTVGQQWKALYIGQTDKFSSRIPNHDRLAEAIRKGATYIHARILLAKDRDEQEQLLIRLYQPPLNTLLR